MIGDALRANPECLFSNLTDAKSKLMTGQYAFTYVYIQFVGGVQYLIYKFTFSLMLKSWMFLPMD